MKILKCNGSWQDLPHLMYIPSRCHETTNSRWDGTVGLRAKVAVHSKGGNTAVAGAVFKDNKKKRTASSTLLSAPGNR